MVTGASACAVQGNGWNEYRSMLIMHIIRTLEGSDSIRRNQPISSTVDWTCHYLMCSQLQFSKVPRSRPRRTEVHGERALSLLQQFPVPWVTSTLVVPNPIHSKTSLPIAVCRGVEILTPQRGTLGSH